MTLCEDSQGRLLPLTAAKKPPQLTHRQLNTIALCKRCAVTATPSRTFRLQAVQRDGKAARLRLVIMRQYNAYMSDPTRKLGVSRADNVL